MGNNNSPPESEGMLGVECPICHDEAFQFFKRKVEVLPGSGIFAEIKYCSRCNKNIKAAEEKIAEEKRIKERLIGGNRFEKRAETMKISHEWARNLNGKKVLIRWDVNTRLSNSGPDGEHTARGVAYSSGRSVCGGWGQVKIILDPKENKRVKVACHETMFCQVVKRDMYHAPDALLCDKTDCKEQRYVMDGRRWGLQVYPTDDDRWWLMVTYRGREVLKIINKGIKDI